MSASAALPAGDLASVEAFRRLLESANAPAATDSPVLLTDRLVGPKAGDLLRRCAVPHEFDSALLGWLGEIAPEEAEERYAQFTDLSLMQIGESSLTVHERWRAPLWRWWLAAPQRARFVALNERLVEWFTRPESLTGEDPAARRRMFHLIGCRHDDGMAEFDRLFRIARHRRRFSECTLLLELVREYDPLLTPAERTLLNYHDGKIAIDMRQWSRALPMLRAIADDDQVDARLRVNAQARLAHALRQMGRLHEARSLLDLALAQSAADPAGRRSRWRLLYELGEIERDEGQADRAAQILAEALGSTNDDGDDADVAGLLNSLGTVQLKLRDTDGAIASFEKSLEQLRRRGDMVRPGMVHNNIGLAQLERCDWQAAESAFSVSLDTKRAAGDVTAQATTLLNLARAQAAQGRAADAQRSAAEAQALFERGGDEHGASLARQARARLGQIEPGMAQPLAAPVKSSGLPWWAWVLIAFVVLIFIVGVFAD